jgi:hypothetical protein
MLHRHRTTLVVAAIAAAFSLWSSASSSADAQTTAFARQVGAALKPADQAWVSAEGAATLKAPKIATSAVAGRVNSRFAGRGFDAPTIEVLVMAVLAEAEQNARRDMQELAAVIEASNRMKEALRNAMDHLQDPSCSDALDQQAALELQKATQQANAAATLASNIAKKYHEVMQQIIGNIKG